MNTKTFASMISVAAALALATGCPASDDSDDEGGSAGTETSADETGGDGTSNGSMSSTMGGTMTTTASTTATTATTTATTGTMPQPNGSMCAANEECESGQCFVVGVLGGLCGECLTDADCDGGGCTIPNPLANPPVGATCNMGEQGEGCMDDSVCADMQVCAEILNVPGVINASTCSDCTADADCTDQLCNPSYDVLDLSGFKSCVDMGTVADGEGCDFVGSGDEACENQCAIASVMGLLMLGVCSECECEDYENQTGCVGCDGGTCAAPEVDLAAGLVAGTCM